jgi:hypothetical protein
VSDDVINLYLALLKKRPWLRSHLHSRFDSLLAYLLLYFIYLYLNEDNYIQIVLQINTYTIMSASDNEYEQYLNEFERYSYL